MLFSLVSAVFFFFCQWRRLLATVTIRVSVYVSNEDLLCFLCPFLSLI